MNVNEMIGRLVCETDDGKMDGALAKDVIDLIRLLNKRVEAAEIANGNGLTPPSPESVPAQAPPSGTFIPSFRPMGPFGMCVNGCGVMTGSPDKICSACRETASTVTSSESSEATP